MKYIRTKDKIIDLTSKQVSSYEIIDDKTAIDEYGVDSGFIMVYYYNRDVGEHIEYDNKGGHSMDNWYLKDILKQSDTIPELCDLFIIDLKGHCADAEYDAFRLYEDFKEMYLKWKEDYPDIVGCGSIITRDKNDCIAILPVAKANDEGELELI